MPESLDYRKAFSFYHIHLETQTGTQHTTTCPFCGDDRSHFLVNLKSGQWNCYECGLSGNWIVFLKEYYRAKLKTTTASDYRELSSDRGLYLSYLRDWGLARTGYGWLIPQWNDRGKFANLLKWEPEQKVMSAPGCKVHLFIPSHLHHSLKHGSIRTGRLPNSRLPVQLHNFTTVYICEGIWDAIALETALEEETPGCLWRKEGKRGSSHSSHGGSCLVVATSGTYYPEHFFPLLAGKKVYLLGDNDHPKKLKSGKTFKASWDAAVKLHKKLTSLPREDRPSIVEVLRWGKGGYNPELKTGYDIRDLFREKGSAAVTAFVRENTVKITHKKAREEEDQEATLEPIPCDSFSSLLKYYRGYLHLTKNFIDTLAVSLSVVASTTFPGDPIWLRIIGPPGSGKSTIAEAISASPHVFARSHITGIHSGFRDYSKGKHSRDEDASLVPHLDRKTMVIKDADTLLTSPHVQEILAHLRDLYDGTSRTHYRNKQSRVYQDIRCTIILCGTDHIRTLNRSVLGERFLDCEVLGDAKQDPYLDRAAANAYENLLVGRDISKTENPRMTAIKQATMGFIEHLKSGVEGLESLPVMTTEARESIKHQAQVLGHLRVHVHKANREEVFCRPRVELATRVVSQLTRLALCLCLVLGRKTIDHEIIRMVRKVVLDTVTGYSLEIVKSVYKSEYGLTNEQLSKRLGVSEKTIGRCTEELIETGVIQRNLRPNNSGIGGRHLHYWILGTRFEEVWRKAGL